MKIYLACGLTHVPRNAFEPYVAFIHALAAHLERALGAEVKYALRHSDPQLAGKPPAEKAKLCYLWDRAMVEWADLIVAECSYPSTGVGIELQIAEQRGTPIVICFNNSAATAAKPVEYSNPDGSHHQLQIGEGHVTLMALGLPTVLRVLSYDDPQVGLEKVAEAVSLVERPLS
jgi:hypothetical protein